MKKIIVFIFLIPIIGFSQNKKELTATIQRMKNDSLEIIKSFNEKELNYNKEINKLRSQLIKNNKELEKSNEKIKFIRDSIKFYIYKDPSVEKIVEEYLWSEHEKTFTNIDYKIDGKIERKYIDLIKNFEFVGTEVKDLSDLKNFHNLEKIYYKNAKFKTVDLSNLKFLKEVTIKRCEVENLYLNNCVSLENLSIEHNNLNKLNINDCANLKVLDCYDNKITKLDISKNNILEALYARKNNIKEIIGVHNIPPAFRFEGSEIEVNNNQIKSCNCLLEASKLISQNKDYDPQLGWPDGKEPSFGLRMSEIFTYGLCPEGCEHLAFDSFDEEVKKLQGFKMCSDILERITNTEATH